MPDDADAPVAGLAREAILRPAHQVDPAQFAQAGTGRRGRARAQRLFDRGVHRVILVVAGHLLDQHAVPRVLENDEVADEIEEARPTEDALDEHLDLREMVVVEPSAVNRAPGHEAFAVGGEGADACMQPVGDDQGLVEGEEGGDLRLVRLELVERGPNGGLFVGRVLQLQHRQRQAVDEERHIRAALVAALHHGELVDRQPVVVGGIVVVQHAHQVAAQRAVGPEVFHGHALNQHAMSRVVGRGQRGAVGPGQLAVGLIQRGRRHVRVEPRQRVPQPPRQHRLAVVCALRGRLPRRDAGPIPHRIAQFTQPRQRGLFDDGLGESGHGLPLRAIFFDVPESMLPSAMFWTPLRAACTI